MGQAWQLPYRHQPKICRRRPYRIVAGVVLSRVGFWQAGSWSRRGGSGVERCGGLYGRPRSPCLVNGRHRARACLLPQQSQAGGHKGPPLRNRGLASSVGVYWAMTSIAQFPFSWRGNSHAPDGNALVVVFLVSRSGLNRACERNQAWLSNGSSPGAGCTRT